ncbi:hypothetical protein CTAYLR_009717 [Chrysophaeum taylorii]|uniref:C2 domain-containing protein n=1 Tax=Chrysophaeum taylorii TaxID=2483200 RepID=A0AAD7UF85_9STRA|nr:hypothetical protein CTAYLR_009717 [Chrysophaeum taylorii]
MLHCTVVEAREVPPSSSSSSSGVLCVRVQLVGASETTSTTTTTTKGATKTRRGANFTWNETVSLPLEQHHHKALFEVLEVSSKGQTPPVGWVEVDLEESRSAFVRDQWHALEGGGKLRVKCAVHSHEEDMPIPRELDISAVDPYARRAPTELQLVLVRAKLLLASSSSSSQPGGDSNKTSFQRRKKKKRTCCPCHFVLECDGEVRKSSSKAEDEPVFLERFDFATNDRDAELVVVACREKASEVGRVTIPLRELESKARQRRIFHLGDGFVELVVAWRTNPREELPLPQGVREDVEDEVPEELELRPNELIVVVLRAKNLPAMDTTLLGTKTSSDPYVRVACDYEEYRTSIKRKCLRPIWNETFRIHVEDASEHLFLDVYDKDELTADDLIGSVVIDLNDVKRPGGKRAWYPLKNDDGNVPPPPPRGALEVFAMWRHSTVLDRKIPPKLLFDPYAFERFAPNELVLHVVRAKGLAAKDFLIDATKKASSDPYVCLSADGQSAQTTVKWKNLDPKWEESFVLPMVDDVEASLVVEVFDRDVLSGDDLIGSFEIPLSQLSEKRLIRDWFPLSRDKKSGALDLFVLWRHNPDYHYDIPQNALALVDEFLPPEKNGTAKPPNELVAFVVRAKHLPPKKDHTTHFGRRQKPSSFRDSFVGLALATADDFERRRASSRRDVVEKTVVVPDTLHPVFCELKRLPLEDESKVVLECSVWDYREQSSSSRIGSCRIPLADIPETGATRKWYALEQTKGARLELWIARRYDPELALVKLPQEDQVDPYPEEAATRLQVVLVRGRGFERPPARGRHSFVKTGHVHEGSLDPYVVFRVANEKRESQVRRNTPTPVWKETFEIDDVDDPDDVLEIDVRSSKKTGGDLSNDDHHVGHVQIRLNQTYRRPQRAWHRIVDGKKLKKEKACGGGGGGGGGGGELELILFWFCGRHKKDQGRPPSAVIDVPDPACHKPANRLVVSVLRGRRLPAAKGDKASCKVRLKVGRARECVTTAQPTRHPSFHDSDGSLVFFDDIQDETLDLEIKVEADGQLIAVGSLPLVVLANRRTRRSWVLLRPAPGTPDVIKPKVELALRWIHAPDLAVQIPEEQEATTTTTAETTGEKNELRVVVIRCRHLTFEEKGFATRTKGLMFKKRKFHVTLACAEQTAKTSKVHAERWIERFNFEADDATDELDLSVFAGDTFVGRVTIPFQQLQCGRGWYLLADRLGDVSQKYRGEIELWLDWVHNEVIKGPPLPEETECETHPLVPANSVKLVVTRARKLGGLLQRQRAGRLMPSFASAPAFLVSFESTSTNYSFKTSAAPSAVWNERFSIADIEDANNVVVTGRVECTKPVGANDVLGSFVVAVKDLRSREPLRKWYHLIVDGETTEAKVEICARWLHDPQVSMVDIPEMGDRDDERNNEPNELRVTVVRARRLKAMDRPLFGGGGPTSSDPYVTVSYCGDTRRTQVIKRCLNPVFMESFAFEAYDLRESIRIEVLDRDVASRDDIIGRFGFPLSDLASRQPQRRWYDLDNDGGQVDVVGWWHHNPDRLVPLPGIEPDAWPDGPPNLLVVSVIRARNLIAGDFKLAASPSSDPFVVLELAEQTHKTRVINTNLWPVWNETFRFHIEPSSDTLWQRTDNCEDSDDDDDDDDFDSRADPQHVLKVTVRDYDLLTKSDLLGSALVPLRPMLLKRRRIRAWYPLANDSGQQKNLGAIELALTWQTSAKTDRHVHGTVTTIDDTAASPRSACPPPETRVRRPNELVVELVRIRGSIFKLGSMTIRVVLGFDDALRHASPRRSRSQHVLIWQERFLFSLNDCDEEDCHQLAVRVIGDVMDDCAVVPIDVTTLWHKRQWVAVAGVEVDVYVAARHVNLPVEELEEQIVLGPPESTQTVEVQAYRIAHVKTQEAVRISVDVEPAATNGSACREETMASPDGRIVLHRSFVCSREAVVRFNVAACHQGCWQALGFATYWLARHSIPERRLWLPLAGGTISDEDYGATDRGGIEVSFRRLPCPQISASHSSTERTQPIGCQSEIATIAADLRLLPDQRPIVFPSTFVVGSLSKTAQRYREYLANLPLATTPHAVDEVPHLATWRFEQDLIRRAACQVGRRHWSRASRPPPLNLDRHRPASNRDVLRRREQGSKGRMSRAARELAMHREREIHIKRQAH